MNVAVESRLAGSIAVARAHGPAAEASWVAAHDFIALSVARGVARRMGCDDPNLLDDYRQTGRLALVEAYRRIDPSEPVERQRAYAWTAVRRRTRRLREADEQAGKAASVDGTGYDIEDEGRPGAETINDGDATEYALERLTSEEKRVVDLRFGLSEFGEHTAEQIARDTGESESTVRRTLRSALDKMRRALWRAGLDESRE